MKLKSNLRGSTVAFTDANGNVIDRIQYSAYGMVMYRAGTNDTPFLFNGRYDVRTDVNGLLCMRARYYNLYICRFINADPDLNLYGPTIMPEKTIWRWNGFSVTNASQAKQSSPTLN